MGIGAAIARAAVEAGATVSLIARDEATLRHTADAVGARWASADVSDGPGLAAAIAGLEAAGGPADVLVCSAGVSLTGLFVDVPLEEFEQQMAVNYLGTVHAIRAVLPGMLARRRGHLVLVSSTAGLVGVVGLSGYAATKFALVGMASSLRYEVEPSGVRVSVLHPPDTQTPGFDAENRRKPRETAAVSGTITPVSADTVAAAVIEGVRKRRARITVDPMTRALGFGASLLEPLARPWLARTIRRSRRSRVEGSERG